MKLTTDNSTTSPAKIKRVERAARAFQLRKSGMDYQDIADTIFSEWVEAGVVSELPASWSKRHAHKDVTFMLQEHRDFITETIMEISELEMARLDDLLAAVWDRAIGGHLESIDRVLKIMDRRAKMLGLDKMPEADWKVEIVQLLRTGQISIEEIRKELGDELAAAIIEYASQETNVGGTAKGAIQIELGPASSE